MEPVVAGHPLHPSIIPIPVGVFPASYVLDILAMVTGSDTLADAAYYNMVIGWLGSVPAAATGFLDWRQMAQDDPAKKTANTHGLMNAGLMGLYTLNLLVRAKNRRSPLGFLLSTIGTAGLVVSGYLGGEIAYGRGWRVRNAERFELEWQKQHKVGPFAEEGAAPKSMEETYPPETIKGFQEKKSGQAVYEEIQQSGGSSQSPKLDSPTPAIQSQTAKSQPSPAEQKAVAATESVYAPVPDGKTIHDATMPKEAHPQAVAPIQPKDTSFKPDALGSNKPNALTNEAIEASESVYAPATGTAPVQSLIEGQTKPGQTVRVTPDDVAAVVAQPETKPNNHPNNKTSATTPSQSQTASSPANKTATPTNGSSNTSAASNDDDDHGLKIRVAGTKMSHTNASHHLGEDKAEDATGSTKGITGEPSQAEGERDTGGEGAQAASDRNSGKTTGNTKGATGKPSQAEGERDTTNASANQNRQQQPPIAQG